MTAAALLSRSGAATNVARAAVTPCAGCFAVVDVAGRLVRGRGVASVTKSAEPGLYGVRFRKPISACAWTATIGTTMPAELIPASQVSLAGGPGTAGTGREGIYVNASFTTRILDLSPKESDAVLRLLFEHVAKPEFTVRWRWRPGDVAFWDNRLTQHYALADYLPHRRVMHRATILGDRPH